MTTQNPRPAHVNASGTISLGHGTHVWTADDGVICGVARLGAVSITFEDPQQVRDVIAYLAGLAGEMDAEITRHAAEYACAKCHAEPVMDGQRFGGRCLDMCHEALEFDHCCMICATPEEAKALGFPVVSLPEPENQAGPTCARCGSGAVVTLHADGEYRCHNPKRCAERVAARDAEAAQVTR